MTDRPWMTALEKQFFLMKACSTLQTTEALREAREWEPLAIFKSTDRLLRQAECFAWTAEPTSAVAFASKTIPETTTFHRSILPSPSGWWWFDVPLPMVVNHRAECNSCNAMLWGPDDHNNIELQFCAIPAFALKDGDNPAPMGRAFLRDGQALNALLSAVQPPDDSEFDYRELQDGLKLLRVFVAGCVWLQQRICISSSGHIERHRRKQLARETNAPVPSDVKVIQLRRMESSSRPPSADGDPVDWSCRWIVNGHWRNQPYKDKRELIYIMPYVKGPEEMPLRVPSHTVYQVSR